MVNIKARKALSDLYKVGVEVRFYGPGKPPEIAEIDKSSGRGVLLDDNGRPRPLKPGEYQIWVQPPSPQQREMALRDGQASRARSLIRAKRHEDSEEHLTIMAFLVDMSPETLVDYVLLGKDDEIRAEAQRDVLAEDEWSDITQLQDALRQFDEMTPEERERPEIQEEYEGVMARDTTFGEQVSAREREIRNVERDSLELKTREQLEKIALDKRADMVGNQAFMYEYERQMLFYGVRDFDATESCFFGSATELAEQHDNIQEAIRDAYSLFISDTGEAKNWSGAASGSDSSEPPNSPETSAPSIPEVSSE